MDCFSSGGGGMTRANRPRPDADGLIDGRTKAEHNEWVRSQFAAAFARLPAAMGSIEDIETEPAEMLTDDNLNDVWDPKVTK